MLTGKGMYMWQIQESENGDVQQIAQLAQIGGIRHVLIKVADVYDEDVDNMVSTLTSLLEPIMILFLGGAVGFIVVALFAPLVKLIQEIG